MGANEAFSHEAVTPKAAMTTVMRQFWTIVNPQTSVSGLVLIEEAWNAGKLGGTMADGRDRVSVYLAATWRN